MEADFTVQDLFHWIKSHQEYHRLSFWEPSRE